MTTIVFRPKKIRRVAWACAVGLVAVFTVVGLLLGNTPTGVIFRTSDQVAMILLGFLLAGGVLLLTRPKVTADASGVDVRNVVTSHHFEWKDVLSVSFPDGAAWAGGAGRTAGPLCGHRTAQWSGHPSKQPQRRQS